MLSLLPASGGGDNIWMGANDLATDGTWVWVDEEEWGQYTNWGPAEPNGSIMEQCLEMVHNTGTWNDLDSNILRFSMCKMRALAG